MATVHECVGNCGRSQSFEHQPLFDRWLCPSCVSEAMQRRTVVERTHKSGDLSVTERFAMNDRRAEWLRVFAIVMQQGGVWYDLQQEAAKTNLDHAYGLVADHVNAVISQLDKRFGGTDGGNQQG